LIDTTNIVRLLILLVAMVGVFVEIAFAALVLVILGIVMASSEYPKTEEHHIC